MASKKSAKKKTSTTRTARKASKKTSAKKGGSKAPAKPKAAGRPRTPVLDAETRRGLLAAREGHDDLTAKVVAVWEAHRGVRVPGLTPSRLMRLSERAEAAERKEETVRARLEARLRPLADARMVAEDALMRAVLELWAEVKHRARRDPALLEAFTSLQELAAPTAGTKRTPEPEGGAQ